MLENTYFQMYRTSLAMLSGVRDWARVVSNCTAGLFLRAIFVWPWQMVSVSVRYLLFYQPMDEKIKTWLLRFSAKQNPNMEKALFHWPIVLQHDVKAKYRLISRKFSAGSFFTRAFVKPTKVTRVCIRSINQSNRSISDLLFFLFCSRVFISRSYEIVYDPPPPQPLKNTMMHAHYRELNWDRKLETPI